MNQYSILTSCCFFSLFKCCSSIVPLPLLLSLSQWYIAVWLICDRLQDTGQCCRTAQWWLQFQTPSIQHLCCRQYGFVCVFWGFWEHWIPNVSVQRILTPTKWYFGTKLLLKVNCNYVKMYNYFKLAYIVNSCTCSMKIICMSASWSKWPFGKVRLH